MTEARYYRRPDRSVVMREQPQVDGKPSPFDPVIPYGAVEISAEAGAAAFAAAAAGTAEAVAGDEAVEVARRKSVYDEALGLGFSANAAAIVSRYEPA